jgi:hypothetical protein
MGRRPRWSRAAWISVLRRGLLIGGLVIITDLAAMAMIERTATADEIAAIADIDEILNYALYALLGVLVVRDTNIIYAGVVGGFIASVLDAIVVSAASLMMQPTPPPEALWIGFGRNLITGTVFAGLSGIVYVLVQRWSGGQRSRR